jgi:pimeloyl-ACP methyl ester carboxylesterase
MKAYFISGLAADQRVFNHIRLPKGFEAIYLTWISPQHEETLQHYALRLAKSINTNEPFILIGLSFGGMLATEIAKQLKPLCTILISSIPVSDHLPGYFKAAGRMGLHKMVPVSLVKSAAATKRFLTHESATDKKLLWKIIDESDPRIIRWGMDAILKWDNKELPKTFWHIHGSKDEVLPIKYTKPTHIINGGGHMMIMEHADEVNKILGEVLEKFK